MTNLQSLDAVKQKSGLTPFLVFRFGLVQACFGMIVALTNSTMNRVMVVELGWAAAIPGLLVGLHYVIQLSRPKMGHGSDVGGARTPWIIGGMAVLALSALLAAIALLIAPNGYWQSLMLAVIAFMGIGLGVSASGTSLLALVAKMAGEQGRAPAATTLWIMMIAGIAISSWVIGLFLDPFSLVALARITAIVGVLAVLTTSAALWGVERQSQRVIGEKTSLTVSKVKNFRAALAQVMADRKAREFTIFVLVSMLAYSCQDLILEPFGGLVFDMTPGETTQLGGTHHGGAFLGMVLVGVFGAMASVRRLIGLKSWMIAGCILSGIALALMPIGGMTPDAWSLSANVAVLGFGNGMFTIGAVGMMMQLAGEGGSGQEGVRMGVWGAAQAIGFGFGGSLGSFGVTAVEESLAVGPLISYGSIFTLEALVFLAAAWLALRLDNGSVEVPDTSTDLSVDRAAHRSKLSSSSRVDSSFSTSIHERPST